MTEPEARLAAIVASTDDAIVSKDLDGVIVLWNRAAERMFGYTPAEAIGSHISIIVPDDRLAERRDVLSQVRSGLAITHFETRRRRKDGGFIDIDLTVSPIRSADGVVIGASKIARDISDQKRLRQLADEASRMKDEFLAVFSHELRTPLNNVLGNALLLRKEVGAEYRERALESLERNAQALARLVNDILESSRIITGKLRLSLISSTRNEWSCRRWRPWGRRSTRGACPSCQRSRRGCAAEETGTGSSRRSGMSCRTPRSSRQPEGW